MNRLFIEIWVPENEQIETGHNGRINPDLLRNLAANYTANVITDEQLEKIADGNGQRAYYQTVKDIVSSLVDELKAGNIDNEDAAREWLHETIDGHHDVIYTACAKDILRYSDNEDALADEYGSDELVRDGAINWSGMAFAALMADVMAEIEDIGSYFTCVECHYTVDTDCKRADDGFPTCHDCANPDEDEDEAADEDEDEDETEPAQ